MPIDTLLNLENIWKLWSLLISHRAGRRIPRPLALLGTCIWSAIPPRIAGGVPLWGTRWHLQLQLQNEKVDNCHEERWSMLKSPWSFRQNFLLKSCGKWHLQIYDTMKVKSRHYLGRCFSHGGQATQRWTTRVEGAPWHDSSHGATSSINSSIAKFLIIFHYLHLRKYHNQTWTNNKKI